MRTLALLLTFAVALTVTGCNKRTSNTTIVQGGVTLVGNFPGSQIIEHLVSDDGNAFTHSGAHIHAGLQVFWNCANGTAIILYLDKLERLWAHYWNGAAFTPGVELRGTNQHDLTDSESNRTDNNFQSFGIFRVLFLNTNVGGRNGDALILWTRLDDPLAGSATDIERNLRLYGTYFDVSVAGSATSAGDPTVQYGFETQGLAIDFNNVNPGATDDGVTTFGFISDSLKGTHAFDLRSDGSFEWPNRFDDGADSALVPATRSGDPTSYVWLAWRKGQRDGTSTVAERFYALQFSLAQVGNALPTQASLGGGSLAPVAGATISDGTAVDSPLVVHNGCAIWRSAISTGATGLFMNRFDATGNLGTIELSQSALDSIAGGPTAWGGTIPEMPIPANVYGDDHGLTSLYGFFRTTEAPGRIAATMTNLGAPFGQAAREISPIQGGPSAIIPFAGSKASFAPETRINRTGEWIFVTWLQGTLAIDAQLAGIGPSIRAVHMHGVQTRRTLAARTLANSIVTGGPFLAPNQAADTNNPLARVVVQSELADGMHDPLCGIQSNANRINLAWHEGDVNLKHNGLTITLSALPTAPPTAIPSVPSGGLVTESTSSHAAFDTRNGLHPVVTDLGTPAGDPLIYFLNNQQNPLSTAAPGYFREFRVFGLACIPGSTPADAQLVSTDGPNADNAMNDEITRRIDDYFEDGGQFLHVKTTPTSRGGGAFGGTRVHLFFMESRHGENSLPALRTRLFLKSAFSSATAAATFASAHAPALGLDPRDLGMASGDEHYLPPTVHTDGDERGPFTAFCTASGNTVGIYFTTTAHFWYQEFNGNAWMGAPEIIDNESPASIFYGRDNRAYAFPPMLANTCDNLNGALLFYSKMPPGEDPGHRRWWVRVHD